MKVLGAPRERDRHASQVDHDPRAPRVVRAVAHTRRLRRRLPREVLGDLLAAQGRERVLDDLPRRAGGVGPQHGDGGARLAARVGVRRETGAVAGQADAREALLVVVGQRVRRRQAGHRGGELHQVADRAHRRAGAARGRHPRRVRGPRRPVGRRVVTPLESSQAERLAAHAAATSASNVSPVTRSATSPSAS